MPRTLVPAARRNSTFRDSRLTRRSATGVLLRLLVVDGDPSQDIRALRAVRLVMKGGDVVRGPN